VKEKNPIVIAIDGHSSCGKSTLARQLADSLHYIFIDTGAMYRGVTLFALKHDCIEGGEVNESKLIEHLGSINLTFKRAPETNALELFLNEANVSEEIRSPEVAKYVSEVAKMPKVREKMVRQQRLMGANGGIVMDGRDIGSVVFPKAELKLFVTASIETRVQRRYDELIAKGVSTTRKEVRENLEHRDHIDSTRKESPLIRTKDAILLDNTNMTREEQLSFALSLVESILKNKP
jgi:cytidylate kinase